MERETTAKARARSRSTASSSRSRSRSRARRTDGDRDGIVDIDLTAAAGAAVTASRLVQRAATILEEELAYGIDAVQRVENRFVDVEGARSKSDDELVVRFRRDAHEIIDILMDLLDVASGRVTGIVGRAVRIGGVSDNGSAKPPRVHNGATRVAVLEVGEPVAPGALGQAQMSIENDEDEVLEGFALVTSGLVSETGDHIGPENVTFDPAAFDIVAHTSQRVVVSVAVPASATPGSYSGVVQTTKIEGVRAVLVLTVV